MQSTYHIAPGMGEYVVLPTTENCTQCILCQKVFPTAFIYLLCLCWFLLCVCVLLVFLLCSGRFFRAALDCCRWPKKCSWLICLISDTQPMQAKTIKCNAFYTSEVKQLRYLLEWPPARIRNSIDGIASRRTHAMHRRQTRPLIGALVGASESGHG